MITDQDRLRAAAYRATAKTVAQPDIAAEYERLAAALDPAPTETRLATLREIAAGSALDPATNSAVRKAASDAAAALANPTPAAPELTADDHDAEARRLHKVADAMRGLHRDVEAAARRQAEAHTASAARLRLGVTA